MNHLKTFTNNLPSSSPSQTLQNNGFYIPYGFFKADNRDNAWFPNKGIYVDAHFKYFLNSIHDDLEKTSMLFSTAQWNRSISPRLTLQLQGTVGITFHNELPAGYNYFIGGLYQQRLLHTTPFYGLKFGQANGDNLLLLNTGLQYRIANKHFVRYNFNVANTADHFDQIKYTAYEYTGHGLTYGFLSPLGPITGSLSYSPNAKEVLANIALGYWF